MYNNHKNNFIGYYSGSFQMFCLGKERNGNLKQSDMQYVSQTHGIQSVLPALLATERRVNKLSEMITSNVHVRFIDSSVHISL